MDDRTKYLLEWVSKLPTATNQDKLKLEDFTDGLVLGKILADIIDTSFFQDTDNMPLVKLVDRMKQYLITHGVHQLPSHLLPNCGKIITRGDAHEIGLVLQLLLGCAINCPRKDDFIKIITEMERMVQVALLEAIDELILKDDEVPLATQSEGSTELTVLQERIGVLSQENHDLKSQLSILNEETMTLTSLNHRLNSQLILYKGDLEKIQTEMKYTTGSKSDMKKLYDENEALAAACEDYERKIEDLESQLDKAHSRMDSRANLTEEIIRLNDEIDILRESVAKSSEYESSIRTYKRRLEEMTTLKANMKILEEKNKELNQANMHLEEEMRKADGLKTKIDVIKSELAETQRRLSQETQRAMKAEFEYRNLHQKHESAQQAASIFQEDKIRLAQQLEEVRFSANTRGDTLDNDDSSVEPLLIRQKILQLEATNKQLNDDLNARIKSESVAEGSKVLVGQLRENEEKLGERLLLKTQELNEIQTLSNQRIQRLEAQLLEKQERTGEFDYEDTEMSNKAVIIDKTIPDQNTDVEDKAQEIREREEKLMASVFYNLSMQLHRYSVQNRNTNTFLEKQRHPNDTRRKF